VGSDEADLACEEQLLLGRKLRVPKPLVQAQRDGRLAIFVGAGVSMGKPSNLPGLKALAESLAGRCDISEDVQACGGRIDRFLGRLEDDHIPIRTRTRELLGRSDSHPTALHRSLVSLFLTPTSLRIVTTNQDRHFSTAIDELGFASEVEVYRSPALPPGDSFSGLVYLHGTVDGRAEDLILTDRDFAKAYMTSAFAARFLERMFATYVVLFVGYSHEDLVMNYFSRGLSGRLPRYALTPENEADKWIDLGITAIPYAIGPGEDEHAELHSGIALWAEYSRETPSQREEHIRAIVGFPIQGPQRGDPSISLHQSIDEASLSYIDWQLTDATGTSIFCRHADGPFWLGHVMKHPDFRALFTPPAELTYRHFCMAEWFAAHFVGAADGAAAGLAAAEELGGRMHAVLWHRIAQELASGAPRAPGPHLGRWLVLVLASCRPEFNPFPLCAFLDKCLLPEEFASSLLAFEFLTRPSIALRRGLALLAPADSGAILPSAEMRAPGEPNALERFVTRRVRGAEELFFVDLLRIVESHLVSAHRQLLVWGAASERYDPIRYFRTRIQSSDYGYPRDTADVLIDAAWILLEWAAVNDPGRLDDRIVRWSTTRVPTLRRLAISAMSRRPDRTADQKVKWILERGFLFSITERAETYELLKRSFPDLTMGLKDLVIQRASASTASSEDARDGHEPSDYERYNLLVWLARCEPESALVAAALAEQTARHPEFRPREHPDLTFSSSFGFAAAPTRNEIEALLSASPADAAASLVAMAEVSTDDMDNAERLRGLEVAAQESFSGTMQIARQLADTGSWQPQIWDRLIEGWARVEKGEEVWRDLIALLAQHTALHRTNAQAVGELLLSGLRSAAGAIPVSAYSDVLALALALWHAHNAVERNAQMDYAEAAINAPGGVVAEILVAQVANLRRRDPGFSLLPQTYAGAFETLTADQRDAGIYAQTLLAGALGVLYEVDPGWTETNLFPLLDWARGERAVAAWQGYMTWGRWSDEYLRSLLAFYRDTANHLAQLGDEHSRQFALHIASILLFSDIRVLDGNWMGDILLAATSKVRTELASHISWLLGGISDGARRCAIWEERLRPYWRQRLAGPLPELEESESEAMMDWLLPLQACLPSVVEMIQKTPPPVALDMGFFWRILEEGEEAVGAFPSQLAAAAAHMLSGLPVGAIVYKLADFVARLQVAGADAESMGRLRDQAIRLGVDLEAQQ